ncbi:hypothetical protein [Streptomyces sp. URMC 129]|uniref:hypothetical protein n=1 Tax=Streptomyces sp. URMC 129 TaxID=3423407 RepID=UPI003F1A3886
MTAIRFTGPVELDGQVLRCPGRGPGDVPRQLTFLATGPMVSASCGQKHRGANGGRKAGCFWTVEGVTPAALQALAQAKPGRIRATLPGGRVLTARITSVDPTAGKGGKAGPAPAAAAHGEKIRGGKDAKPAPHAARNTSGGGTAKAAFLAVAAVANAVGQTAQAAGTTVSSTAGMVGKVADVGREGLGVVRDGIKAVDNTNARRFAQRNTETAGGDE